ncbi:MAG: M28 family peptidase [Planctomycetes bacterium]|nr:M28 family peptidase [Planctomycetota bacterium]
MTPTLLILAAALSLFPSGPTAADPTSSRMLAALSSVKPEAIRVDVEFIASDDLAGRDTPSEGLRTAARFLRSRLERLGWKPGAKDGWFHEYPLEHRVLDEEQSKVEWRAKGGAGTLRFGVDYFLPGLRDITRLDTAGAVVFAGDGSKEDLGSGRVEGKWALVHDAGGELSRITRDARRAKAKGLIVAPGPKYAGEDYAARYADVLARQRKGSVAYPRPAKEAAADEREEREAFPTLLLTQPAAAALLAAAQKPATPAKGADLGITLSETRRLGGDDGRILVENVVGWWPGSDPKRAKECILLSAHYDHVGVDARGQIHNGADDNGSGTTLLLSVAEALAEHGPLERSVMIIWVSGEEKGLWGSKAFAENPWFPDGAKPVGNINIDMVGRNAPDKLLVTPTKERAKDYNELVKIAEKLAPLEGFPKLGNADQYYERSDHYMFARLGIPVMFLFSDIHEDYHRPGDDPEKLDYDKVSRVARLVLRMLDALDREKSLR